MTKGIDIDSRISKEAKQAAAKGDFSLLREQLSALLDCGDLATEMLTLMWCEEHSYEWLSDEIRQASGRGLKRPFTPKEKAALGEVYRYLLSLGRSVRESKSNGQEEKRRTEMPTASDFQAELDRTLRAAEERGLTHIDVESGQLHRRVGVYPGPGHNMPGCCSVMRKNMREGDTILYQPPSGKGAKLRIRYSLPRTRKVEAETLRVIELDDMESEEEEIEVPTMETTLSLERDLEMSLLFDLEQLEPNLRLYKTEGVSGQQLDTGQVGKLDILAVNQTDDLVVIELKAGKAGDEVCGQILRYMGWVAENLAGDRKVKGIIVASDFSEALKYAAKAMPDVALKRYEVRFEFMDV